MNQETLQEPMTPPTTPQPPVQDDAPGKPEKRPGSPWLCFGVWTDRDLDMEGCDTSDWNIFYYYYRHIYQKRALFKLKHLKWFALLFQLVFFGMIALGLLLVLYNYRKKGTMDPKGILIGFLSLGSVFSLQYLIPLFPFLPVFMVCPAFRLRSKTRGLLTSRAKEPPLLAHLVQYTTNKGLVAGALQSLLFTWRKFALLLLPCILASILMLVLYSNFMADTPEQITTAFGYPFVIILFILTLSLFIVMQGFCYRMDTLLVMVLVGFAGALTLFSVGTNNNPSDFWIAVACCFIPACLFAWVYFPLAAIDTNEYGLGERSSKRIRVLLFSMAGVFVVLTLAARILLFETDVSLHPRLFRLLFNFFTWGLFACVSGLLVTSASTISHKAKLLRNRTDKPFRQKLFDPASMVSLLPIFALELVSLFVITYRLLLFIHDVHSGSFGLGTSYCLQFSRITWTVLHFGLAVTYLLQKNNPEIKDSWLSDVKFNQTCMIFCISVPLLVTLVRINATPVTSFFYIASLVFCLVVCFSSEKAGRGAVRVVIPPQEQDDKEAS